MLQCWCFKILDDNWMIEGLQDNDWDQMTQDVRWFKIMLDASNPFIFPRDSPVPAICHLYVKMPTPISCSKAIYVPCGLVTQLKDHSISSSLEESSKQLPYALYTIFLAWQKHQSFSKTKKLPTFLRLARRLRLAATCLPLSCPTTLHCGCRLICMVTWYVWLPVSHQSSNGFLQKIGPKWVKPHSFDSWNSRLPCQYFSVCTWPSSSISSWRQVPFGTLIRIPWNQQTWQGII